LRKHKITVLLGGEMAGEADRILTRSTYVGSKTGRHAIK
jgi:hypothetical protein